VAPSLAGLSQKAIYKQLLDYRAGRRQPQWYMWEVSRSLSLQDLWDVAAFYATQPRGVHRLC